MFPLSRNVFLALIIFGAKAISSYRVETDKDAVAYLSYYGYVDPQIMPLGFTVRDCDKKLKEFQEFSRVPVTGEVDAATLKAMNTPRCGCPDFIHLSFRDETKNDRRIDDQDHHKHHHNHNHNHTFRFLNNRWAHRHHTHHKLHNESYEPSEGRTLKPERYTLSQRRWEKNVVTYDIVQFPTRYDIKISRREIEDAVHKAFQIWGQHINLEFAYQPNEIQVDIEISFVTAHHGDNYPFDGPGKTLAHAFFPGTGLGGDVHFEQDEDWRVGVYNGIDFLHVAVHEIGHSLGLGHSSEYGAVMYPMYKGYHTDLQLHSDDIRGVQEIYGRRSRFPAQPSAPPTTTTTRRVPPVGTTTKRLPAVTTRRPPVVTTRRPPAATTTERPSRPTTTGRPTIRNELCADPTFDAITTMLGDTILGFKGGNVYEISKNGEGVMSGWPKPIASYFKGLEGNLDSAMTRSNGKTYFFKGSKYWRFTGLKMDRGYPRFISEYLPGIPNNVEAAFEWEEEFVFTKGNQFWRFNTRQRPQVQNFYPMPLSHWGLRNRLDAALTAPNGTVYFFTNQLYWEFNKAAHRVNNSPELISEGWLGCVEP